MISHSTGNSRSRSGNSVVSIVHPILVQGGHGKGKTGNLVLTFSRQGKHREFCSDTGKNLLTQKIFGLIINIKSMFIF